ncbi:hypothetical protein ICW40_18650 [Actinotalea ferrariae]|uniref:SSI family serine proteinase inhibitor n=1 Tax=Actinotalea ferrariae TaxID=1386098 RepID=UPI001C8C964F|nr:SSI family serine proteinase inhibitor [Actinotalea ferrariae]MBX9246813.1 hypothetical protein [Actinotalea ferrariae]
MRIQVAVLTVALAAALTACATPADDAGSAPPGSPSPSPSAPPSASAPPTPGATSSVAAELTITLDETGSGSPRTFTLACDPVGGDHPDADAACATLADVGPEAFAPPPRDEMCTQQYGGPEVATVEGTVAGTPVSAQLSRTDGCEIGRWDALAPVLGSAGGM